MIDCFRVALEHVKGNHKRRVMSNSAAGICLERIAFKFMIRDVSASLNPKRTVAELKELRGLTSDENGAQRVAFTPMWVKARAWLRKKLEALPVETHVDSAG